jgi:Tfp pilus assembly PilM family ATPase
MYATAVPMATPIAPLANKTNNVGISIGTHRISYKLANLSSVENRSKIQNFGLKKPKTDQFY